MVNLKKKKRNSTEKKNFMFQKILSFKSNKEESILGMRNIAQFLREITMKIPVEIELVSINFASYYKRRLSSQLIREENHS